MQLISAADAARDAGKQCLLVTALQVCYDHTSWLVHRDGGAQKWILFVACVHWVHVCRSVCTYVNMYLDARR